ncbi:hypothetical protein THTE_4444 [Thermogutta terrifontis]|uniref:Uncharacterized protein n=1 Tax=Thermogutta terrifontis TaxID=1331910 RepID=A0A286RM43_9BACT|nr:hypothetical protein THTE_4444 [Thermogutta terrifontis]
MAHAASPGTTSVPLRGISRRDLLVRSVIHRWITHCLRRGLKSRADSGAKAPHSMECGDLSPLFGEGFSLHHLAVCRVFPRT